MTKVMIVMGSISDWPTMKETAKVLDDLGVSYDKKLSQLIALLIY